MNGTTFETLIERMAEGQPLGISFPVVVNTTALRPSSIRDGRAYPLERTRPFIIGRNATSDLVVNDQEVSRRHCAIGYRSPETRSIRVTDLGTRNGTHVNGRAVPRGRHVPVAQPVATVCVSDGATFAIMDERSLTEYLGMLSRLR